MFICNDLILILIFICLIKLIGGYLLILIFLEVIIFLGFICYLNFGDLGVYTFSFLYNLCYLIIIIFEGVFGLRLILALVRQEGGDFYLDW